MNILYRIYQLFIALPLIAIYTLITCIIVIIGCAIGNGHFWGYYPGKWWAQFIVRILLLPVKVEGRANLQKGQSYVFVANHQGSFDIFLIYGFLCRNFKWMMKRQLRQMPFVGKACESAHQEQVARLLGPLYKRVESTVFALHVHVRVDGGLVLAQYQVAPLLRCRQEAVHCASGTTPPSTGT